MPFCHQCIFQVVPIVLRSGCTAITVWKRLLSLTSAVGYFNTLHSTTCVYYKASTGMYHWHFLSNSICIQACSCMLAALTENMGCRCLHTHQLSKVRSPGPRALNHTKQPQYIICCIGQITYLCKVHILSDQADNTKVKQGYILHLGDDALSMLIQQIRTKLGWQRQAYACQPVGHRFLKPYFLRS